MREPATLTRRALAALPIAALALPAAATVPPIAASLDPAFAQIERHRTLRAAIAQTSGRDADPAYVTACDVEEEALQALGDVLPTTVAGAAALRAYMAHVEADFADDQSPLLRTVLTVARSLGAIAARTA